MKLQKAFFLVLGLVFLVSLGSLVSNGKDQKAQVIDSNVNSISVVTPAAGTNLSPGQTFPMTCDLGVNPGYSIWQLTFSWFQNTTTGTNSGVFVNENPVSFGPGLQTRTVTLPDNINPGQFALHCTAYFYGNGTYSNPSQQDSNYVNLVSTPTPILGCTDPSATNYNSNATLDDGSCTYPTADTTVPSTPTGVTVGSATSYKLTVNWSPSTDNVGVTSYKIYRNNGGTTSVNTTTPIATVNAPITSYTNIGLLSSKSYKFRVRAVDAAGNQSALSTTVSGSTLVVQSPGTVTVGSATTSSLTVTWVPPVSGEIFNYAVYANAGGSTAVNTTTPVGTIPFGTNSFTHQNLTANTTYKYRVAAFDPANNRSGLTTVKSGTTLTTTIAAPSVPSGLSVGSPTQNSLSLSWGASTGVVGQTIGYKLFKSTSANGTYTQIGTSLISGLTYTDTGLNASTTLYYKVQACYTATPTNCSVQSSSASGTTIAAPDTVPPSIPTSLSITNTTQNSISLSWSASTDASGSISGYKVYRSTSSTGTFTQVGSLVSGLTYTDSGLSSGATYWYTVSACDNAPTTNCSAQSSSVNSQTLTVPGVPGGVSVGSPTTSSLTVSWNVVTGASSYNIYRMTSATSGVIDGAIPPFTVSAPNLTNTFTGLTAGTTYHYAVSAVNAVGESTRSTTASGTTSSPQITITSLDLVQATGGTVIGTVTAGQTINTGTQNGGVGTNISIKANTNPATAGSVVFSLQKPNGTTYTATENTSPYTLFGDTAPTTFGPWQDLQIGGHTLTVTPYAGSGGTGQVGVPQTVQFQIVNNDDTTPPVNPTAVTVTYRSSSQIKVMWANSTSTDVSSYRTYRDAASVGVVNHPTNTFTDTTPNATSSYSYKVTAIDASGNEATIPATGSAAPTLSTLFGVNNVVVATTNASVKSSPESTGSLGNQTVGVQGTVTNGPVWVIGGVQYWYVDFATGFDGWVNQTSITLYVPPADTTAPTVTINAPTASQVLAAGTTSVSMTATTSEAATCKWDTNNVAYSSMPNTFTGSGTTSHNYGLLGLTDGTSYTRYVACADTAGNASTTQSRTFSVATSAPAGDPVVNTTCPSTMPVLENDARNAARLAVELCAQISESSTPKTVTLKWATVTNRSVSSITVYRKTESGSWASVGTPAASSTSWTDSSVSVGTYYEYKVQMVTSEGTVYGYVASGIKVPQETYRGRLVLVVDNTKATGLTGSAPTSGPLATQVTQLINDLTADKWVVTPIYVSQTATPASVRTLIKGYYDADAGDGNSNTNTKAVYLFGHVPVAGIGNLSPDGHQPARGISSDLIYGEMTATWNTGSITFPSSYGVAANFSMPSTNTYNNPSPDAVELQVGRVDMYDIPGLPGTENEKLQNYLTKASNFKKRLYIPNDSLYIRARTPYVATGIAGWSSMAPVVGIGNVTHDRSLNDSWQIWNQNHLFALGYGQSGSLVATHTIYQPLLCTTGCTSSNNLSNQTWGGVFNILSSSYVVEWNDTNSILRGVLADEGRGLTMAYGVNNNWYFHHMGMGKTIGYSSVASINNTSSMYHPRGMTGNWDTADSGSNPHGYMTLLGDPTLRAHYVSGPSNLSVSNNGGLTSFSWSAASDSPLGYNVYEIQSNLVRKVNTSIISGTSYASSDTYSANNKYMVTAVKVRAGNSGTYYNESLGALGGGSGGTLLSDTTAPIATITAPTAGQALVAGTTSTTLAVSTDEAATCKWSTTDQAYSSMPNTFTTTGLIAHTTTLSSLADDTSYTRYVRCQDTQSNAMTTSASVSFSVATASQGGGQTVTGINGPVGPSLTSNPTSCTNPSGGTIYYVDANAGNDSNNGTSVSTAWKTITQVNSALSSNTINAGKMVCFKRGGVYRGLLTVSRSGTAASPIRFDAYGAGSAPVISGSALVTNWTQHSGNIWKATVSAPATTPKYLFVGSQYQNMARQPNTGWYFTTGRSTTSISDSDNTWLSSQGANSLAGAEAVMRGSAWSYSIAKITGNSGTTMNGTSYTGGSINYGSSWSTLAWGYILRNKLSFLDSAGEWYFDPATNTVYLWAPNNANPNTLTVEMSAFSEGIYVSTNQSDIIVKNLIVEGQTAYGVRVSQSKRLTFENLEVRNGYAGIHQYALANNAAADRNVFRNNYVHDLNVTGITIEGGDDHLIEGNVVERISMVPDRMYASGLTHVGIAQMGINSEMTSKRNIVRDTGYAGILAAGGGLITENFVERSMQTLTDGSGVTFDATDGLTMSKNIVKDIGVGAGQNAGNGSSPNMLTMPIIYIGYEAKDKGFYFGDSSSGGPIKNTRIENNVIINVTDGIWFDHSVGFTGNTATNNIIYNFNRSGIGLSDYSNYKAFPSGCGTASNSQCFIGQYDNVVTGNKLYSIASYQNPLFMLHSYSNGTGAVADFGTIDSNYYSNPFTTNKVHQVKNFNSQENWWTLPQWQSNSNEDDNSTSATYTPARAPEIFYNATTSNITQSVNGCNLTGNQTIAPFTAIVVEYGNC